MVASFGAMFGSFWGSAAEVEKNATVEWVDRQIETAMDVRSAVVSWGFNGKPKGQDQVDPGIGELDDTAGRRPWPHQRYAWFGKGAT